MITVSNVSLQFGGSTLFKNVNLKFTNGNCYGVIGANGAGKSTFLKILCGELEPTTGEVSIPKELRLSILKQDHFAYDEYNVLDTVTMGNARLYQIIQEERLCRQNVSYSPRTIPAVRKWRPHRGLLHNSRRLFAVRRGFLFQSRGTVLLCESGWRENRSASRTAG